MAASGRAREASLGECRGGKAPTRAIELLPSSQVGAERNRLESGLNAALGDAMGEIKGYNAPEVQEVYSRAQAVLDNGTALREQLFVLNGRFNVASVSADHEAARRIAEQCLELASRHPQSKALAQAHRIMGHMDWAQGQFVEARAHLEQCFAISFSDEVAKDHSQAFVQDVIVPAWGYLSCLLWQLGYSQLAEAAGRQSVPKAREIGQPNRLAFALHSELLRRRLFRGGSRQCAAAGRRDRGLWQAAQLYPARARFYQGVVAAQDADPRPGIAIMRRMCQGLQKNKVGLFAPIHL